MSSRNPNAAGPTVVLFIALLLLALFIIAAISPTNAGDQYRAADAPRLRAMQTIIVSRGHRCEHIVGTRPFINTREPGTIVFCRVGQEIRTFVLGSSLNKSTIVVEPR